MGGMVLHNELHQLQSVGLLKVERIISSSQDVLIRIRKPDGTEREAINFCANNYLGLANDPRIIDAAKEAMDTHGFGMASVRFICGTTDLHKELEERIGGFLGTEDAILYAAAFDANGGVFEPLLTEEDAIISDALNHASIIDGVRLCKAQRYRYRHIDMGHLEEQLRQAVKKGSRYRIIATDGVFSMDGDIAPLPEIVALARKYDAMVMVDDCHATGYIGATGRGTAEHFGLLGEIDIITTTFGKALGGAAGGCVAGRRDIIEMLRQRSRPYLFSNALPPPIIGGTLRAIDIIQEEPQRCGIPQERAALLRDTLRAQGLDVLPGSTAIVPVMLYDEVTAVTMADALMEAGIYVVGFAFPVVPKGAARIRMQLSASHTVDHIKTAANAFLEAAREAP